jgi:hypothetical protein
MQSELTNFIARHFFAIVIVYAAYSTAVDAMEEPTPGSGMFYRWLYRFAHGFAFNLVTAFGKIGRTPWLGEIPGSGVNPKTP